MRLHVYGLLIASAVLTSCTVVGPDYVKPTVPDYSQWNTPLADDLVAERQELAEWWTIFADDDLSALVHIALSDNNSTEIAALRVLESRAQLGIAIGSRYPQAQFASGAGTYVSPADNQGGGKQFWQYSLGASIAWEPDFWGRFRRGIEASDAAFLASLAAWDQATVLLVAQVVDTYTLIRSFEDQLQIARDNVVIQQRSYDITEVLFRNGEDSELDMQQANTLLLSTEASIPALNAVLHQARNAMSTLLGRPPGEIPEITSANGGIPAIPAQLSIGLPADMLRLRPDVRLAELQAMGQSALVGFAEADLYPSFSLVGSISLVSGGPGNSDFGDLFTSDAIIWAAGPSFTWPFLNYGRIKNNIRVQDARLQQALISYAESVIQAAREAEDALAAYYGARIQTDILEQAVASALRSNELSTIRYREGLSDYQRVLDSQQSLFVQQQRLIDSHSNSVRSLISLYKALGAGWQGRGGFPRVDTDNIEQMRQRTDWGDLLEAAGEVPDDAGIRQAGMQPPR